MRYLFGFLCVCALAVAPLVGCSESRTDVFPCTEQGIRDAIAEGGGPHRFDCDGTDPVVTQAEIKIDNDVILDGEGKLTVGWKQRPPRLLGHDRRHGRASRDDSCEGLGAERRSRRRHRGDWAPYFWGRYRQRRNANSDRHRGPGGTTQPQVVASTAKER